MPPSRASHGGTWHFFYSLIDFFLVLRDDSHKATLRVLLHSCKESKLC